VKKKSVPGSLSLSLSLSSVGEESEGEVQRELAQVRSTTPLSSPTTRATIQFDIYSRRPRPATVYVELYGSPSGSRALNTQPASGTHTSNSPCWVARAVRERTNTSFIYLFIFWTYRRVRGLPDGQGSRTRSGAAAPVNLFG